MKFYLIYLLLPGSDSFSVITVTGDAKNSVLSQTAMPVRVSP